ncbi:MAG: hypothetical protein AAF626_03720 [Pseudomonadota bacterium]
MKDTAYDSQLEEQALRTETPEGFQRDLPYLDKAAHYAKLFLILMAGIIPNALMFSAIL